MIELFNQFRDLINQLGIISILIILLFFFYRVLSAASSKWSQREKTYYKILQSLGKWKDSLMDRLEYYIEPSSGYDDKHTETENYKNKDIIGADAYNEVRDHLHVAPIFLSNKTIEKLENLLREYYVISEHRAVTKEDYLKQSYKLVNETYSSILQSAKYDLKRSKYLEIIKKLLPEN